MAQPVVQSVASGRTNTSTSGSTSCNNMTYPTGIAAGDRVLLTISWGAAGTVNAGMPSNFEFLGSFANGTTCTLLVYLGTMLGTESGAFPTLTMSASSFGYWTMARVDSFNPIQAVEISGAATGTSTTPNSPDFTASGWADTRDMMAFSAYAIDDSRSTTGTVPSGYTTCGAGVSGPVTAGATGVGGGCAYLGIAADNNENPPAWGALGRSDTWVAVTILMRGISYYTVDATLKLSNGDPIPDGVKVVCLEADVLAGVTMPGDTLLVRAVDTLANGDGTITMTVFSDTDKVLIPDVTDSAMAGESLITLPITPVEV